MSVDYDYRQSTTMKRKARFCCDASRDTHEDYYANQSGAAMPVFIGARYQRGHDLDSILSGLIRHVVVPSWKETVVR